MIKLKTVVSIFILLISIFCYSISTVSGQADAYVRSVSFIWGYGFDDAYGPDFGIRTNFKTADHYVWGLRFVSYSNRDYHVDVPCECFVAERVRLESRIMYFAGEAGFGIGMGPIEIQPTLSVGIALNRLQTAMPSPVDGPAIVTGKTDPGLFYAPGIVFELPVKKLQLGLETFYINFEGTDIPTGKDRSFNTDVLIGYQF